MRSIVSVKQKTMMCLIAMMCLIHLAEALLCYQCPATSSNEPCVTDISGMVNTSLGISRKYFQNCSESKPTWDRCMIETAQVNRAYVLYHRGCHDGVNFTSGFDTPRFRGLNPNNLTTCEFISPMIVCYTFCQKDFCNGPQPPEIPPKQVCNESMFDYDYGEPCGVAGMFLKTELFFLEFFGVVTVLVTTLYLV
ncbi:uncharacterized protein LOC131927107 [Physella acuta]|uniref:uncharacterized protein LOC131927107 n=1 Tax=Physella acuta TaxID=109671 RepID=UPI0027DD525D|nr:uncharacterized protein LOC131927107 [Physella acuta]